MSTTSTSNDDVTYMTSLGLKNNLSTCSEDGLFFYQRAIQEAHDQAPVLVLLHGYPQTSFMWRHIIPLMPPNIPLFIPDIPGYGRSKALSVPHSKSNQSKAIISALSCLVKSSVQPLVLVGHDRGARICHYLSVHNPEPTKFPIQGAVILDIVPTLAQFQTFSSPDLSMGCFHWPFLATPQIAVPMIQAFGGDQWAKVCLDRWAGKDAIGRARFQEQGAWDVYREAFKDVSVIRATCDDYRAAGMEDVEEQQKDQRDGNKIDCPVLAVYSLEYLGSRYDMKKVWTEWMGKGELQTLGLPEVGHFIPEESPERVADAISSFYMRTT